jgi:hypothetical protein
MKGALVAALVIVIVVVGSGTAYVFWTSADRHSNSISTTHSLTLSYKVVRSNLTVNFNAACVFGPCPTGPWPTKNVMLIDYQGSYYYGINFTYYSGGQPVAHTIWFTNSTVFCISPAYGYNLCPTSPAQSLFITLRGDSASVTNPSLGLSLELRLAADNSNGGSVRITVEELNILTRVNNVSAASNWRIPTSNLRGPYQTTMVGYAVYQGFFDVGNFTSGAPSPLMEIGSSISCTPCPASTYYLFQPMSDNATTSPGSKFWYTSSSSMLINFTENISGYWTSSSNFEIFPAGNYTVLALDQWGQATVLHFTVEKR